MSIICIDQDSQTYIDCPETNYCNLTVNGVNHGNFSFVNVDIPSEIARDYTGDNLSDPGVHNQFTLTVSGYNVDTEYMDQIIAKTELTPTNENVSQFVNGLQELLPYLMLGMLFTYLIYMIRKAFK